MKRYLSQNQFERVSSDFGFLVEKVRKSHGELDLRLRHGYFNLYYKGNSLAKVTVKRDDYVASIHEKFATEDVFRGDKRFVGLIRRQGNYQEFRLPLKLLRSFFSQKNLNKLSRNIARVGYSEEITFEHMLITDNLDRDDLFIIDRQVMETKLRGKRMDLLALVHLENNKFHFQVIEVKLGNNPDLRRDVADQLNFYVEHINANFQDWKIAYEKTYRQMKQLNVFTHPQFEAVEIVEGVKGLIVVGGYSGIAKTSIAELHTHSDEVEVKQIFQHI